MTALCRQAEIFGSAAHIGGQSQPLVITTPQAILRLSVATISGKPQSVDVTGAGRGGTACIGVRMGLLAITWLGQLFTSLFRGDNNTPSGNLRAGHHGYWQNRV